MLRQPVFFSSNNVGDEVSSPVNPLSQLSFWAERFSKEGGFVSPRLRPPNAEPSDMKCTVQRYTIAARKPELFPRTQQ